MHGRLPRAPLKYDTTFSSVDLLYRDGDGCGGISGGGGGVVAGIDNFELFLFFSVVAASYLISYFIF